MQNNAESLKVNDRVFLSKETHYVSPDRGYRVRTVLPDGVELNDGSRQFTGIFPFNVVHRDFSSGQKVVVVDADGTPFRNGQEVVINSASYSTTEVTIQGQTGRFRRSRFRVAPLRAPGSPVKIGKELRDRLQPGMKVVTVKNVRNDDGGIVGDDNVQVVQELRQDGTVILEGIHYVFDLTEVYPLLRVGDEATILASYDSKLAGKAYKLSRVHESTSGSTTYYWDDGDRNTYAQNFRLANEGPLVDINTGKADLGKVAKQTPMEKVMKNPFNSGKVFIFAKGKNPLTGEFGWRCNEIEGFDPVPAIQVPHDLIEHEPGSETTPEEEFKALGAALWLRHETGFYTEHYGTRYSEMMQPAMASLYYNVTEKSTRTSPAPFTREAQSPLENVGSEVEAMRLLSRAIDILFQDGRYRNNNARKQQIQESIQHGMGWIRVGYRRAQKRFQSIDRSRLSRMYKSVVDTAQKLLTEANEGDVMTVVLHPEKYEASAEMLLKKKIAA